MSEAAMHVEASETGAADMPVHRGRTRTCVGCGAQVDVLGPDGADLVRLVLGPGGEIAVDGGSHRRTATPPGRGAHVHARRACVERAARAGLLRATKGQAKLVALGAETSVPGSHDAENPAARGAALNTDSLARAIQRSMDRRIEGLLAAAARSQQLARGTNAVRGACHRGEAALIVVARDAAAAAALTEVRHAVAEGRAVAWGNKERIGAIVAPVAARSKLGASPIPEAGNTPAPSAEEVGVVAITSRHIAEALRQAVQSAASVLSSEAVQRPPTPPVKTGGTPNPSVSARPAGKHGGARPTRQAGAQPRPPEGPRATRGSQAPRGAGRPRNHRSDG